MGIFNVLYKRIGNLCKNPISDPFLYQKNEESFSGNTLEGTNVLVVTNYLECEEQIDLFKKILKTEACNYNFLYVESGFFTIGQIERCAEKQIGPFDHIFNFINIDVISDNVIATIYKYLQIEANYIINRVDIGSICTGIFYDVTLKNKLLIERDVISKIMNGLGKVMANHGIIVNGITTDKSVPLKDALAAMVYLSSKYGQILAGEVLKLSMFI